MSPNPRGSDRGRGQSGFGLIEVLVAMVLMGIVLTALMLFLGGLIRAGGQQKAISGARNRAVTAVEELDALSYKPCTSGQQTADFKASFGPTDDDYWSVTGDVGNGYTAAITSVEFLQSADPGVASATFVSTCPTADQGAQRVSVKVTKSPGGDSATLTLIKRNTACSSGVLAGVPNPVPEGENGIGEC